VLTAAETESHPSIEMEESLSVDSKLNSLDIENDLDNSKTSQEVSKNIINLFNCNFLTKHMPYIYIYIYVL